MEKWSVTHKRMKILASELHVARGAAALARQCTVMAALYRSYGAPPLRTFDANFSGLSQIIVGLQLSTASANAIWSRVNTNVTPFDASTFLSQPETALAATGLSSAKIKTLKALANAVTANIIDIEALSRLPDDDIIAQLTSLHGIGPWTADIYLLFALRRADAFAPGDLALQLAAQRLFALKERPKPHALTALAEQWRPWRGVAARLLWADYGRNHTRIAPKTAQKQSQMPNGKVRK
jgi:DNA-3-methyladenine glycosylase II